MTLEERRRLEMVCPTEWEIVVQDYDQFIPDDPCPFWESAERLHWEHVDHVHPRYTIRMSDLIIDLLRISYDEFRTRFLPSLKHYHRGKRTMSRCGALLLSFYESEWHVLLVEAIKPQGVLSVVQGKPQYITTEVTTADNAEDTLPAVTSVNGSTSASRQAYSHRSRYRKRRKETDQETVVRELKEEIGYCHDEIQCHSCSWDEWPYIEVNGLRPWKRRTRLYLFCGVSYLYPFFIQPHKGEIRQAKWVSLNQVSQSKDRFSPLVQTIWPLITRFTNYLFPHPHLFVLPHQLYTSYEMERLLAPT